MRYLPSGAAVLNVTVANNIGYGDKQKALFIRCALFGKRAEGQIKDFLLKGQQIMISGELSENEYQANDGTTKKSLELTLNVIDLIGKKPVGKVTDQAQQQANNHQEKSNGYVKESKIDNFDDFDDDILF